MMRVNGEVTVPGDKSISHRALMFAALARPGAKSVVREILDSADVRSTASVLRALGVPVPAFSSTMAITGVGRRGLAAASAALDCGNSGTTARLMSGILAASPFRSVLVGDDSLSRRPMGRVARPLEAMGAHIQLSAGDRLPMRIDGARLSSIRWKSETASAQVKSAILLAGLVAGVEVTVDEPSASRDHTERFLRALGATLRVDAWSGSSGSSVTLAPVTRDLSSFDLTVPGDPSSAAFFAALASLADTGSLSLLNVLASPTRDGFFRTLSSMGGVVARSAPKNTDSGETVTTYEVTPARLRSVQVGAGDVPSMIDELPLLACLAAHAEGETVISGAEELRVKESDRIAATVANLREVGVQAEERPDGMVVVGSDAPLKGRVVTRGDHRIAMAFGILGRRRGNVIEVDDPDCVAVSFPSFWRTLDEVTR
ncbi:MAG TPA: 3-phosphoshikimate 1-carboxyvinyltransferase [Gemmatimonadaceae bacterium]|nr:3-phosphoshikimate 1-carboxyvinyltransferase [Gemmatimonadaceae bacterium]